MNTTGLRAALWDGQVRRWNISTIFLGVTAALMAAAAAWEVDLGWLQPSAVLPILTGLGILVAAAFGIVGKLVDFRNDEGQITPWGATTFVGTVVAGLVSVSTFIVQQTASARSAESAARESARFLTRFEGIGVEIGLQTDVLGPAFMADYARVVAGQQSHLFEYGGKKLATNCLADWPDFGGEIDADSTRKFNRPVLLFLITDSDFANGLRKVTAETTGSPDRTIVAALNEIKRPETPEPRAFLRTAETPFLTGYLHVPPKGRDEDCARAPEDHPIRVYRQSDDFMRVRTTTLPMADTSGDGSILGGPDLHGRTLILAGPFFDSRWGQGSNVLSNVAIRLPPYGTFCFGGESSRQIEIVTSPNGGFVAFMAFDAAARTVSSTCQF